ncbi:unnamed protein product [marine sediment metagenome]|uniref:Methyltransferase n=1 Tax=marine sediment metagenome TaxID=412755 RepID=X0TGC9_9ZZZZ
MTDNNDKKTDTILTNDPRPRSSSSGGGGRDSCQTPDMAVDLLTPYIKPGAVVWEPACGEGYMARRLTENGFNVIASDLIFGVDFLTHPLPAGVEYIISNPPFSRICYKFLARMMLLAAQHGIKWALLMKSEVYCNAGYRNSCFGYNRPLTEIIIPTRRIDYKMPGKGWEGDSTFHTNWYTYKMGVGHPIIEAKYPVNPKAGGPNGANRFRREPPTREELNRMLIQAPIQARF